MRQAANASHLYFRYLISIRIRMNLNFSKKDLGFGYNVPRGGRVPFAIATNSNGQLIVADCHKAIGAHGNADWAAACGKQAAAEAARAAANQATYCKASGLKGATRFGFTC
jgi:hypothetical protein